MSDYEKRCFASEVRAQTEEGQPAKIVGNGAVFNSRSENLGGFREIIMPGAFDDVLNDDVRATFNHDPNFILGRSSSGTLRIATNDDGLGYEIDAPSTQTIRDLVLSPMARGDIKESSFGFRVAQDGDEWLQDDEGIIVRKIHRMSKLFDIGPVTFPAYQAANSAKRSMEQLKQAIEQNIHVRAMNEKSYRERMLSILR
ncbi:HK97 family phage prohead protease [Arsukibacterium sp.]|uniref:HK97 family phage prohead protease n=1 Tax=Arsukibacterium sp. TaxID=1977258 RepID=UPI00299EB311|nr:HK97 family phage prohead protease [Arsukibacterium sp.]MDX1538834.1 HK97 family phage prohead protease [Arsukibacterium sp.]